MYNKLEIIHKYYSSQLQIVFFYQTVKHAEFLLFGKYIKFGKYTSKQFSND